MVVDGNETGTSEAFKTRILLDEQDAGFGPKSYVLKNNAYVEFSGGDATFHPGDTLVTTNKVRIYVRSGTTIDLRGTTFMGGGTTALACLETGRRFVGVELSREYHELAGERIKAGELARSRT